MIKSPFKIILTLIFAIKITANSQSIKPAWLINIDAYNDCDMADIEVDNMGNTYASFNYQGALTIKEINKKLDYGKHMHGGIIKVSPSGKILWAMSFKSAFDNRIRAITVAPDGDLLVTGFGDGLMRFPAGSDSIVVGRNKGKNDFHNPQGIYVARINPDGITKWVKYWNTGWGEGLDVTVNSKNEVAFSYYHSNSLRENGKLIDSLFNKHDYSRLSIAFLNPNGELIKIQKINEAISSSYTPGINVAYDPKDNLYVYGKFKGKIKFTDTDSLTNDSYHESIDSYIAKFSPDGKYQWSKKIGGRNVQTIEDITFGDDLSVYATGIYSYECTIGDGIKLDEQSKYEWKSGNSFFLFNCFTDGELAFARYHNTDKYNSTFTGNSLAIDLNNNIHLVGTFTDTVSIDGFQLARPNYPGFMFYSRWNGNQLEEITEVGDSPKGWIFPTAFRINGNYFAGGGMYHGSDNSMEIRDKKRVFSNFDYGRASFLYGGIVPNTKPIREMELTAMRKREINLSELAPLLVCFKPEKNEIPAPNRWIPEDTTQTTSRNQIGNEECGVILNEKSAKVFPNPTNGPTTLELIGMVGGSTRVDIFSNNGQLLLSKSIDIQESTFNLSFDLSSVAAGTYFVRIIHDGYEKALRVVKVN